jgi:hypothetical protein
MNQINNSPKEEVIEALEPDIVPHRYATTHVLLAPEISFSNVGTQPYVTTHSMFRQISATSSVTSAETLNQRPNYSAGSINSPPLGMNLICWDASHRKHVSDPHFY